MAVMTLKIARAVRAAATHALFSVSKGIKSNLVCETKKNVAARNKNDAINQRTVLICNTETTFFFCLF